MVRVDTEYYCAECNEAFEESELNNYRCPYCNTEISEAELESTQEAKK